MDTPGIAELNRRFGILDSARVVAGNGGLAKIAITLPAAAGEMYLHGAHVTSWRPRGGEEVLFVSSESRWEDGRAIRGGVPICFPWFGGKSDDPGAPAHGFVRSKTWRLDSVTRKEDAITVSMSTESNDETKKWWLADFRLVHRATFGSDLSLELTVTNTGTTSFRFEEALHSYFRVGAVDKVRLQGLNAVHYLDKTDSNRKKMQEGSIVIASETDRVYPNTPGPIQLEDRALGHRIEVAKENSHTTVVWNPWIEKARALSDFGDDEWKQMVCIEASNVGADAVTLDPGQQHRMKAMARVAGL
jgi:glucose-6-phosphate 1-epimerase